MSITSVDGIVKPFFYLKLLKACIQLVAVVSKADREASQWMDFLSLETTKLAM